MRQNPHQCLCLASPVLTVGRGEGERGVDLLGCACAGMRFEKCLDVAGGSSSKVQGKGRGRGGGGRGKLDDATAQLTLLPIDAIDAIVLLSSDLPIREMVQEPNHGVPITDYLLRTPG